MKALFLDRDGTLMVDRDYLADPVGVEVYPGTGDALCRARRLGYRLFLFTNQSGIGRGYHTLEDTHRVNARLQELLGLSDRGFDEVCIAPEKPDEPSRYRKPSPRFIEEMIAKYALDPQQCFMIGDKLADVEAGINGGIVPVLVLSGKLRDAAELPAAIRSRVRIYPDVATFVATLRG